jgi:hypothetical protein
VGEPAWTGNQPNEGRALVYHGSASGLSYVPAWTCEWFEAYAETGASVAWAGDVNGDGYDDVIVGIPSDDRTRLPDAGMVRIFHGSASGLSTSSALNIIGQELGEEFGTCVNTAGDVNADGYADIVIGSPYYDGAGTDRGRVQVWLGSASGIGGSSPDWEAEGEADGDAYGTWVGTAGDADGDGYADLIVGAPHHDSFYTDQGKGYVYRGSATGPSLTPDWAVTGWNTDDRCGASGGTLGDVNGDGLADFAFGAPGFASGNGGIMPRAGDPDITLGGITFLNPTSLPGEYGTSVGTAGDTNGDGFSEMIVGAPYATVGFQEEGQAHLVERYDDGFAPRLFGVDATRRLPGRGGGRGRLLPL